MTHPAAGLNFGLRFRCARREAATVALGGATAAATGFPAGRAPTFGAAGPLALTAEAAMCGIAFVATTFFASVGTALLAKGAIACVVGFGLLGTAAATADDLPLATFEIEDDETAAEAAVTLEEVSDCFCCCRCHINFANIVACVERSFCRVGLSSSAPAPAAWGVGRMTFAALVVSDGADGCNLGDDGGGCAMEVLLEVDADGEDVAATGFRRGPTRCILAAICPSLLLAEGAPFREKEVSRTRFGSGIE